MRTHCSMLHHAGIEAQIIVARVVPFASSKILVVLRALLVNFLNHAPRLVSLDSVVLLDPLDALLHVGIDENLDHVALVSEHVVRAAAHDDAGRFLVVQLADDLGLQIEQVLAREKIAAVGRGDFLRIVAVKQPPLVGLVRQIEQRLVDAAVLRSLAYQLAGRNI